MGTLSIRQGHRGCEIRHRESIADENVSILKMLIKDAGGTFKACGGLGNGLRIRILFEIVFDKILKVEIAVMPGKMLHVHASHRRTSICRASFGQRSDLATIERRHIMAFDSQNSCGLILPAASKSGRTGVPTPCHRAVMMALNLHAVGNGR